MVELKTSVKEIATQNGVTPRQILSFVKKTVNG
jgi:hypothetical protein